MTLPAGARLGPYELLAPLGAGAMGQVYRARDRRLRRQVAVKVLPQGSLADAEAVLRFEHEARAAGSIDHPNVVAVFDTGVHEGTPYVVTELLQGETLRQRLGAGPVAVRKALDYAVHIALGLAAAHDKGIIHRDLKPENLFVTKGGLVKILDFGLAKRAPTLPAHESTGSVSPGDSLTDPGTVLGTAAYMSPEQVRGQSVDARSDVFSFGLVLYEMLAGRRAFAGETAAERMAAILNEEPSPLAQVRPEIPVSLERLVLRCLEKRPEERFQEARDVAFAIQAFSTGAANGVGVAAPAGAPKRRRILIALTGLAALGAVFVLGRTTAPHRNPGFRKLTLRSGPVGSARFSQNASTVFFTADANPPRVFSTGFEKPQPRPLGLPPAILLAISPAGEMAIRLARDALSTRGTLAQVAGSGGTPRELLTDVQDAGWAPDGRRLCVLRGGKGGEQQLEFPPGTVLYRPTRRIQSPRVSPRGDRIAFSNGEGVQVIDAAGRNLTTLTSAPSRVDGLAWSPRGDEVWFTAGEGASRALHAVTLAGTQRLVYRLPGNATLEDISTDGRLLMTQGFKHAGIVSLGPGQTRERELSGLDEPRLVALSADGGTLLADEADGSSGCTTYLLRNDGAAPVRLGRGCGCGLSPDGSWALSLLPGSPARLVLLPTEPGEPKPLALGGIDPMWGQWFPDGTRLLVLGREPGHPVRLLSWSLESGASRPLAPDGFQLPESLSDAAPPAAMSPDGKLVAVRGADSRLYLVPGEGGDPREIPGPEALPLAWSADARSVFVLGPERIPGRVYRLDPWTGEREIWKEMLPSDPTGVIGVGNVQVTPDGRAYAFAYRRQLLDLYLVEGLK